MIGISFASFNLLLILILTALGANYYFIPEDEDIFSACNELPDTLDINGLLDLSELKFEFDGEKISVEGDTTLLWEVENTDRITIRASSYRWKRGTWEPTILNMATDDFCKDMWREDREWFLTWGQFVDENSRKCLNHKGNVYHQKPFDVSLRFNDLQGSDWTGRYKIQLIMQAFDKEKKKRKDTICINILGDLEKIK